MSTLALSWSGNTLDVAHGTIREEQRGPWVARVECAIVDSSIVTPVEGTPATLTLTRESGATDIFVGAVRRSAIFAGDARFEVALVGGAGKLTQPLSGLSDFVGVPSGLVLRTMAKAAGETLAAGVEAAIDALYGLPRWHVVGEMSAAECFDAFASELGRLSGQAVVWRILADGTMWVGVETWPVATYALPTLPCMPDLDDRAFVYAPDGAPFAVGQSVDGINAIEVAYTLVPGELRARVRSPAPGDPGHRPALDLYRAPYSATVVSQRADGTLDVTCADARIGELTSVPIRTGVPGATVQVPSGAGVTVRFASASPAGAYIADFDATPPQDVVLTATGAITVQSTGQGTTTIASAKSVTVQAPLVALGANPGADVATTGSIVVGSINLTELALCLVGVGVGAVVISPSPAATAICTPSPAGLLYPLTAQVVSGEPSVQA